MIVVVGSVAYRPEADGRADAVAGRAAAITRSVAAAGTQVQLVAKIGDDGAGDAIVVALGRDGIGHAAVLRDPARPTAIVAAPAERPSDDETGGADGDADRDADGGLSVESLTSLLTRSSEPGEPGGGPVVILPPSAGERPTLEAADLELALRYLPDARVVVVAEPVTDDAADAIAGGASFWGAQLVVVVEGAARVSDGLTAATVFESPAEDPGDAFARMVAAYAVALDAGRQPGEAFAAAVGRIGWERTEPD